MVSVMEGSGGLPGRGRVVDTGKGSGLDAARGPRQVDPDQRPGADVRLLDAAERLFAEHGIAGVSLRNITAAAGVNVASAHYYFGSKEGLVEAIFQRRMGAMEARRTELLNHLEAAAELTARDVAEALVRPLAELVIDPEDERRYYVSFLAVTALRPGPVRTAALRSFDRQRERFGALLATALPDIPREVRMFRFLVAVQTGALLLADLDWARLPWDRTGRQITRAELIDQVVDALAGLLAGAGEPAGDLPAKRDLPVRSVG